MCVCVCVQVKATHPGEVKVRLILSSHTVVGHLGLATQQLQLVIRKQAATRCCRIHSHEKQQQFLLLLLLLLSQWDLQELGCVHRQAGDVLDPLVDSGHHGVVLPFQPGAGNNSQGV